MRFFDKYDKFYTTGIAYPEVNRLDKRYMACINDNLGIINKGASKN